MSKISGSIAKPPLRSPWLVLFSVSIAQLMSVMGITFLLTGLPQIAVDLGSSLADLQWIVIVYTLVMAATVPLWGRLSDLV
ncbi:MAG TPA: MFS transporter, partial [Dehalococcoidia bacterium]|nr:MFS transporter [Dehalococcoidia bacterium]